MTQSPDDRLSPHAMHPQDVVAAFNTSAEQGLCATEATARRAKLGPNRLTARRPASPLALLRHQFESPVVLLLATAALIAMALGEWKEGAAIWLVLLINSTIGFVTELRAARSMEALRRLGNLTTRVRREGHDLLLPADDLVPGDIVILEAGDMVTADLRLLESSNLSADEATMTGESIPVDKHIKAVAADAPLAERPCMAFKGTAITRGSALGVVVATGLASELGKISQLVETASPERSPLEHQLQRLSGQLIWFTLGIVALLGAIGVFQGQDIMLMIEAAIALAVATIPEGLPVVATMALARGMWRMAQHNALIERLSAVETLGATSVIFTDKTGTLTENRMQLREIDCSDTLLTFSAQTQHFQPEKPGERPACLTDILTACLLCNNAALSPQDDNHVGDPLEQALLQAALAEDMQQAAFQERFPRVQEIAFEATTKLMATIHTAPDGYVMWVKGAPEAVLAACTSHLQPGAPAQSMTPQSRAHFKARTDAMAARGMRVLAVARRSLAAADMADYSDLTFLGLLGLYDPPRQDVPKAIAQCRSAGIRVIMLTGDHGVTAKSIATAVGLTDADAIIREGHALHAISEMPEAEIAELRRTDVFARVSPAQKLQLVAAFQKGGDIVAMTGDGVNDAPALKQADIGVAMGKRGTQVAREAAAMILRDDAFSSIVAAIREGRVIFRNIQRFVTYLLSCNLSEVLVVGAAVLANLPLPLMPLQILFLNLVTDVFPAFALGAGDDGDEILQRPPRGPGKPILTRALWMAIIGHSLSISAATLGAFILAQNHLHLAPQAAVTVSFFTLALAQLWHVFNMRDPRSRFFLNVVTRNKYVWMSLLVSAALLMLALYVPLVADQLALQKPTPDAWALILGMSLVPLGLGQIAKPLSRLYHNHRPPNGPR